MQKKQDIQSCVNYIQSLTVFPNIDSVFLVEAYNDKGDLLEKDETSLSRELDVKGEGNVPIKAWISIARMNALMMIALVVLMVMNMKMGMRICLISFR